MCTSQVSRGGPNSSVDTLAGTQWYLRIIIRVRIIVDPCSNNRCARVSVIGPVQLINRSRICPYGIQLYWQPNVRIIRRLLRSRTRITPHRRVHPPFITGSSWSPVTDCLSRFASYDSSMTPSDPLMYARQSKQTRWHCTVVATDCTVLVRVRTLKHIKTNNIKEKRIRDTRHETRNTRHETRVTK